MTSQKVLIVGGGNVGLSFALLLAHHGIQSTLLEKSLYPKINPDDDLQRQHFDSRNMALSRRTIQIYQDIGLWQTLQHHACRIERVHISEQHGFGKATLDCQQEKVENFGQVMENAWLGQTLLQAVQRHPLIELIDGADVTEIQQNQQQVTIQTTIQNQQMPLPRKTHFSADLLVACDGQNSICRNLLGIQTKQHDYQQVAIVGVVMTDQPHDYVAIERFNHTGAVAVLPLIDAKGNGYQAQQGYRRSVVWVCQKGEEHKYLANDDYFLNTIQQTFGQRAGNFTQVGKRSAYPLVKILAKQQVVGRCVMMGNAAHTLHPVAGQGFNLCMRDADTLANMLFQQINHHADIGDPHMLLAYHKRRQKDQKRVTLFCDTVIYGFSHPNPMVKFARNLGLIAFDKLPKIKPLVANYAMGLKS